MLKRGIGVVFSCCLVGVKLNKIRSGLNYSLMTRVSKAPRLRGERLFGYSVDPGRWNCSSGGTKQHVPFNEQGQGQRRKNRAEIKEGKSGGVEGGRGRVGECAAGVFVRGKSEETKVSGSRWHWQSRAESFSFFTRHRHRNTHTHTPHRSPR